MTPQIKGTVPEPEGQRILDALALRAEAQTQVELAVADALKAGGSVREVSAFSGLSGTTVQKYGRAHGWPTQEQREGWEAAKASQDEWAARLAAATAVLAHMEQSVADGATPEKPEP
ncbi:helix-turn-helix DNA binding domain protein [Arthrobacter phage MidnightRain]|nr:helix-turn-helix DNA binding domain protein [Arthrobacter phage MidnightRain]